MMKASELSIVVFLMICQTAFGALDCPAMYHGIKGHSACVSKSSDYESGGISKADKTLIVKEHNKARAAVQPPACNMLKLYWNDDLAYIAQKWADNCVFEHDKNFQRSLPGSFSVGQNLAKGHGSWTAAIKGWEAEKKDFTLGADHTGKMVGHYTQMIAEKTSIVGCGFSVCKGAKIYVCNYGPSGNVGAYGVNNPYTKCDKVTSLKDCNGKFCKNGGSFKEGTCDCKCNKWKHIYGPDCSTNCSVEDTPPCETFYKADACPKYANVPPQCPWTCKTCPFLDNKNTVTTAAPKVETTKAEGDPATTETIITGKPTFRPNPSGAAAFKSSVMALLSVMVLFAFNLQ